MWNDREFEPSEAMRQDTRSRGVDKQFTVDSDLELAGLQGSYNPNACVRC